MSIIGHIGTAATALGVAGGVGGTAFVLQQWQSGDRLAEQVSAEKLAGRQSNAEDAGRILDSERPSDRARDWDKLGVIGGTGAAVGAGGLARYAFDSFGHEPPVSTHGGKVGAFVALGGLAAVVGAAAGVANNTLGDRFG